jgi:hypothetical protein
LSDVLRTVLNLLARVDNADDLLWLEQSANNDLGGRGRMHGHRGGLEGYSIRLGARAAAAWDEYDRLDEDERKTFALIAGMLHRALKVRMGDGRGSVRVKTQKRDFPEIDFETGLYVKDEDGKILKRRFYYNYVYIRQYASGGDDTRDKRKFLMLYADQGMGKGGTGGYVAAALDEGLITDDDILDAWAAGQTHYSDFIQQCAVLIGKPMADDVEQDGLPPSEDSGNP